MTEICQQAQIIIHEMLVCVDACPTDNFRSHADEQMPFKCIACGACARECPADALEVATA